MPDLKQALKDFVATSNSGKYKDDATLLSKFPELKGYDVQALKDFVATSNSGKYKTDEELFSKFPEFNQVTPEKKKVSTASPSVDGSLVSKEKTPKPIVGNKISPKFDEKGKLIIDVSGLKDISRQAKQQTEYEKQIQKQEAETKANLEKEFVAKGQPKIDKSTNKYLNEKLGSINSELIKKREEFVVPQLNYQFKDLGFNFEESGATGDWMVVTAPDKKTKIEISLDPFLSSKASTEAKRLQDFIKQYTPDKGLYVIEKSYNEENKKINSQKDIDNSIKKISDEANNLNLNLNKFLSKKNEFDKNFKGTPEDLEIQNQLIAERDELIKQQDKLKMKEISLNKSVGKYSAMKSEQGTWLGGTLNWLLEGAGSITAGMTDIGIDILAEVMPTEGQMSPKDLKTNSISISKKLGIKPPAENQTFAQWKNTLTEDQLDEVEDELDDITKKSMKSQLIPGIRESNKILWGDKQTTPEWEKLKQEDFWGGAYAGVMKSIPAMIGGTGAGGWAQRTAQFYSQISDGIRQEMSANPEFDKISENEKLAVILPIGITGAVLEEFGLKNIKGSTGLINEITMSVLGKTGVKTTAKTFRELVQNEVESKIAKGALTITSAGLAEAETGAGQQAAEFVIKDIYNAVKDKEMFHTPKTTGEWIKDVVVAGAQEAVGGFILGVPTAVSAAYSKKGFLNLDDNTFEIFEAAANDDNIQKAYITSLKTKITQGTITTAEAKEQLNNYRNSVGLFKSLPDGLNIQQKKEAMNLLKEKRDLQNQVDGKDAALVKPQKERIEKINESLTKLSEDAIQEQEATTENVEVTPIEETPIAQIPEEISNLGDEEVVTLNVKTLDEVPEQFRERARLSPLSEIETRKKILGLPIGKKETKLIGGGYTYTLTGKEAKDYAIQVETTGQVPVQSETGVSETLAGRTPEAGTEVATEETITTEQPQAEVEAVTTEEVSSKTPEEATSEVETLRAQEQAELIEAIPNAEQYVVDGKVDRTKITDPNDLKTFDEIYDRYDKLITEVSSKTPENVEVVEDVVEPTVPTETQGLSEAELPGYNRMNNEVEGIISKSKQRGVSEAKTADNVMNYVMGSKVYENATDVQREALVREVNKRFGIKEKSAPSANRILGKLKDVAKITMSEKAALVKQIKDKAKGAKDAIKSAKIIAEQLSKEIKELASKGNITPVQAANAIRAFSKVNVFNDVSVARFVEYMSKVFANAEYANKIDVAKSQLKNAKKNIKTKIGIADGLMLPLQRLFSINPSLIPDAYLDEYLKLVDMFSAKQAVLTLSERQSTTNQVEDILSAVNEEQSLAEELADRFEYSENKVFNEDGSLNYSASIKQMLDANEITQEEADLMKKYKSDIIPQVEKSKATDEEIQEEKKQLISLVKSTEVSSNDLPTKYEKGLANQLKKLIGTDAINSLNNTELKNLLKVIDNINNGYLPHYAQLLVEKMNGDNNSEVYENAIDTAKPLSISKFYSKVKSLLTRKGAIDEMVRRNPLFYIDQLFGDFKSKNIFNSLFNKPAEAVASFKAELKNVQSILEKAEERVAKSFKLDPNKTLMSKFKMMTYMIQLEYESNEGNKQVNPAAEYLKATIKHIDAGKSQFGERDANMLQKILDKYGKVVGKDSNGKDIIEIDLEKLNKSFNSAEKQAIKDIRGINESLTEKAEYTSAIIRGQKINPLNNYVHLNVLSESKPNDIMEGGSFADIYNQSLNPSTKAKSLIERTRGAKPLNFDIFASAQRGAKFTLMDFHLTEPIRTGRKTINQTTKKMENKGRIPKEKRQILNAINSAYEETVSNLITNAYVSNTLADDVIDFIGKQGYRAVLAGTGRFASEFVSNTGYALISNPKAAATGLKYKGFIMSTDAPLVLQNVNSKQTNRIFPNDTLSGNMIDQNILSQYGGIKGAKSKNPVRNKIQQIWNLKGKKYKNAVELISDTLISTPDKIVMRPLWFGSFANEFKNETGVDIDFEKIAANDEAYMSEYKDAIENAKTKADEVSVMAGATDNPFMGILKGTVQPNQGITARAFNNFNNYMTRFLIFEFVTARTGIMAAMGNGSLSRKEGAAILAGVTTRMVTYTLLTQLLGAGLMEIFSEDDEEEDEKSILQKLGQSIASGATSLILGRDFGNATKLLINYGIEKVNEEYLDFLREGEYDPYKDAIAFSLIPQGEKAQQTDFSDLLMKMGGSFGPALNTTDLLIRKLTSPPKQDEAAIERSDAENKVRLPLEILGVTGFIPLYKDIRKVVMKNMYKDIKQSERMSEYNKTLEQEKLQGYKNKSDMKTYNPDLYELTFGELAPDYDEIKAKRELEKQKRDIEKALKDDYYNYQPRKKGGFGSEKFGGGNKKSGFGSNKFGSD